MKSYNNINETHQFKTSNYNKDFLRTLKFHTHILNVAASHVKDHDNVLDLGCGPGLFAEKLLGMSVNYTGYDISEMFVNECHQVFAEQHNYDFEGESYRGSSREFHCNVCN